MKNLVLTFNDLIILTSIILTEAAILWKIFQVYSQVLSKVEHMNMIKQTVKGVIEDIGEIKSDVKVSKRDINNIGDMERKDLELIEKRLDRIEEYVFNTGISFGRQKGQ